MKLPRCFVWMCAICCVAWRLQAAPFTIVMELQGGTATQSITNAPVLNRAAAKVRPVFHAGVDERLKLRFRIAQTGGETVHDAGFHLYVAPEEKLNQAKDPDFKPDQVIIESALSADFATGHLAQGTISFRVSQPGYYLVRLEGLDMEASGLNEPFVALDLEVQKEGGK